METNRWGKYLEKKTGIGGALCPLLFWAVCRVIMCREMVSVQGEIELQLDAN